MLVVCSACGAYAPASDGSRDPVPAVDSCPDCGAARFEAPGVDVATAIDHPYRRRVLESLLEYEEGCGAAMLAISVASREAMRRDVSVVDVGFRSVREDLLAEHLPSLADAGLVAFRPATEWVEPAVRRDVLERLVDGSNPGLSDRGRRRGRRGHGRP